MIKPTKKKDVVGIISAHKVKSREVDIKKDLKRVLKDAEKMMPFLEHGAGVWQSGHAIAHSQITKDDPLRFFLLRDGRIIINPKIVRHTQVKQQKKDACLTFYGEKDANGNWRVTHPVVMVPRWTKCEVEFGIVRYQDAEKKKGPYVDFLTENVGGKVAQVFQHEIDHMDGIYIYDHTPNPLNNGQKNSDKAGKTQPSRG